MIKNEEYIDFLKKIICCINKGDYYSIKELSYLKLNKLREENRKMKEDLNKYLKNHKDRKKVKDLNKNEINYIINKYVEYIFNQIEQDKKLKETVSLEEFIQNMV